MGEWKKTALGEVLDFGNGKSRPMEEGSVPVYGGNGILGYTNRSNYSDKTIAIGRVGAYCGAVYFEDGPVWISDNALAAKAKAGNDALFFYYLLKNADLNQHAGGSSHPLVTQTLLNSLEFSICRDEEEQRAIASVLSSLDAKIDLLHRQNKTLEAMAEALFRQWFVEEAEEGWSQRPLSTIATYLNGVACQKYPAKDPANRLPVLKIKELSTGITDSSDWATSEIDPKYHVVAGDVIFSWSATLMVKLWDGPKAVLNQHLFKVTSDEFPKWFYFMWTKHYVDEFVAIAESHATTFGHIKRGDLDEAMVIVPGPERLKEMTAVMAPLFEKHITNSAQIKSLTALRDTLLPKLMSGEVRVEMEHAQMQ
jgi:type I restriction enzyme S subunit